MSTVSHAIRRLWPLSGLGALLAVMAAGVLPAPASAACPNEAVREQQGSTYLPECRGFEMASPVLKNEEELPPKMDFQFQIPFRADVEGPRVAYSAIGVLPESESGGLFSQYLSQPGGEPAWMNQSLNPESTFAKIEGSLRNTGEFMYFSPDLKCGLESTRLPLAIHHGESQPQLPAETTAEEEVTGLYLWDAATNGYHLITKERPEHFSVLEEETGEIYSVAGASSDCGKIIFESKHRYKGAPERSFNEAMLYEWNGSSLEIASVLPDGKPVAAARVEAGEKGSNINQISRDGARVFFTATADEGPDLGKRAIFMREGGNTVEISGPQGGPAAQNTGARYQGASVNGDRVFFTANYGLTTTTSTGTEAAKECNLSEGTGCDLYEYRAEGEGKGKLTDLSADVESVTKDKHGANVRGVVGISDDGSVVYFSASGQLVPGQGKSQEQLLTEKEANVYASHEGSLAYVSTIGELEAGTAKPGVTSESGQVDALTGGEVNGTSFGLRSLAARVSPSGSYLMFATTKKIKEANGEYNNEDKNISLQQDWERYEYSLASGSVICVSCNPNRSERPQQPEKKYFAPLGPFVEVRDGALQRYVTDNGTVFFETYDPIVPQATNKTVNVYQWTPEGVGDCPSGTPVGCTQILDSGASPFPTYLVDASANGQDVFLTTYAQLAPGIDEDGLRDIYDVRVGGGVLPPPPPPSCSIAKDECQPQGAGLGAQGHASESGAGGGNVTPGGGVLNEKEKGPVKISRRSVRGATLTLVLTVPGSGRVSVTGSGLNGASRQMKGAGSVTLRLTLTAKQARFLKRHKHKHLTSTVRVTFVPSSGAKSTATTRVRFG